jgi:aminoglycoside phosphotransferase (APT) family kinase protein
LAQNLIMTSDTPEHADMSLRDKVPALSDGELASRLTTWFGEQLPDADDVTIDGLGHVDFGHSAEMLVLTVAWRTGERSERHDVVVRIRPAAPGLLEPYDLRRQFDILRAVENTPVRAPRALWIDETGDVLGRPFYVMERLDGAVYEREIPDELGNAPDRIHRMSERVMEQIAAIHLVDLQSTGLDALGDGQGFLDRELARWEAEMHRWQRAPLPALERLLAELRHRRPDATPRVTLVHGDTKGGNFAFVDDEVSGVFDWEMASIGDPMTDIGWLEVTWRITKPFSELSQSDIDRLLVRYQELTGIIVHDRPWHRSLQAFKMAVIMLVGAMLFDAGYNDDQRLAAMGQVVPFITQAGLRDLGIEEQLESGPVAARQERVEAARQRAPVKG